MRLFTIHLQGERERRSFLKTVNRVACQTAILARGATRLFWENPPAPVVSVLWQADAPVGSGGTDDQSAGTAAGEAVGRSYVDPVACRHPARQRRNESRAQGSALGTRPKPTRNALKGRILGAELRHAGYRPFRARQVWGCTFPGRCLGLIGGCAFGALLSPRATRSPQGRLPAALSPV